MNASRMKMLRRVARSAATLVPREIMMAESGQTDRLLDALKLAWRRLSHRERRVAEARLAAVTASAYWTLGKDKTAQVLTVGHTADRIVEAL